MLFRITTIRFMSKVNNSGISSGRQGMEGKIGYKKCGNEFEIGIKGRTFKPTP